MAYVLQSLVQILEQDQHKHHLSLDTRSEIESFLKRARSLRDLVETSTFEIPEDLECRIQSAAHEAEDIFESYISYQLVPDSEEEDEADYELELTNVIENFDSIREEIFMLKMVDKNKALADPPQMQLPTAISSSHLWGLSKDMSRLINQITGQQSQLQVIPIVGIGGSGKSFIARRLYEESSVLSHVDARAWTTISKEFNLHDTLLSLLDCLVNASYEMRWEVDDEQLGRYVHANLVNKRYLIVVDDIWHTNAWEILKRFFPDDNNGSRIILTTRECNVAEYAKTSFNPHQMLPINEDESWSLLCQKVFGNVFSCPPELVEIGRKIARNCRGHPLAIDTIAGFLCNSDWKQEDWQRVESHQLESTSTREEIDSIKEDKMSKVDRFLKGFVDFFAKDGLRLVEQLMQGQPKLQVIPTVGSAESTGKTSLARLLYDRASRTQHFDAHGWVSVEEKELTGTKPRNVLTTLKDLLDSLHKCGMPQVNDVDISVRLHKTLKSRRYLIVVDNIRDSYTWDAMRRFFPDEGNGSRVILTAREWSDYGGIKPFRLDSYWEFLLGKVVEYLPTSEKKLKFWKIVEEKHVSSGDSDYDLSLDLLSMSYNNLPRHLKPCFLYMGAFPEDHVIQASYIIQLWIAEGFIHSTGEKTLEDTALMYLETLISRNLLYTCKKQWNGRVTAFKIHDVFRTFYHKKALDEKFLWFKDLDGQNIPEDGGFVRRVSVHPKSISNDDDNEEEIMSSARTFLCNGPASLDLAPMFLVLRLLRVLDVLQIEFDQFPNAILKLVNLRYMAITCDSALPSSISIFRNLQTLITSKVLSLPSELWEIKQLRYIDCRNTSIWNICGKGESFFHEELQTVIGIPASEVTYKFLSHNPNLKNMMIIFSASLHDFLPLDCLKDLEVLVCSPAFSKRGHDFLPYIRLPASLKSLSLNCCVINSEIVSTHVGLLPSLEILEMRKCELVDLLWEPAEGGYPRLKLLRMTYLNLVHWRANSKHFPELRCLEIRGCHAMKELPSEIGEIPTLELIEVDEKCSSTVLASAKKIWREQKELGNDLLRVFILDGAGFRKSSVSATNLAEASQATPAFALQNFKPEKPLGEELHHMELRNSSVTMATEAETRGYSAFSTNNFADAIRHYTEAINLSPLDHLLHSYRAEAYAYLEQFSEALNDAQKAVQLKPDRSEGYSILGAAYLGLHNYKDAISIYKMGLEINPDNDFIKCRLFLAKGALAYNASNFTDAVQHFTDAIHLFPSDQLLYNNRSLAYDSLNQFSEALSDAQKSAQLRPELSRVYSRLGNAYMRLQNYKDAISAYEKGIDIDPSDDIFKSLLCKAKGKSAFSSSKFSDAILHYTDAINLNPSDHCIYSYRSEAHAFLNQFSRAMSDAQETIRLEPDESIGYARLGDVYLGLHIYNDAISAYDKGLQINPDADYLKCWLSISKAALSRKNNRK